MTIVVTGRDARGSGARRRCCVLVAACLIGASARGQGVFVEQDVEVIHQYDFPGTAYGWGVSELADIDDPPDGVMEFIVPDPARSVTYVYSGRTGEIIHVLAPPSTNRQTFFGYSVADAGDVDNDGLHDIVVGDTEGGAPTWAGRAFVYSGRDGSLLFEWAGESNGSSFGSGVGCAGDVNEDGHADVLVGANTFNSGQGRAYIFSGLDGSILRTLDGESPGDVFGAGTAGTGDVDGDGIGDQIVGAPGAGSFGKAYVFSGADGSLIFDTASDAGGSSYGTFFVAGVGDVNNDGVIDVYVGDFGANGGAGRAYVYSGADGSLLHLFSGDPGDGLGCGRGAGDVDGDQFADLITGHYTSAAGAPGAGRVTIRSGRTGEIIRTITSLTQGEQLGFDAVGIGDVNGDDKVDFLLSAAQQSNVYVVAGNTETGCPPASPAEDALPDTPANRYLSIAPHNVGVLTAVRVELVASALFPEAIGAAQWVGPTATYPENGAPGSTFTGAALQCEPHFADWGAIGVVRVFGAAIVPDAEYAVRTLDSACAGAIEANLSDATTFATGAWGDIVAPFAAEGVSAQPDFSDISALVEAFTGSATAPIKARSQLQPNVPDPNQQISFTDISLVVDAFTGRPYPFDGPDSCGP